MMKNIKTPRLLFALILLLFLLSFFRHKNRGQGNFRNEFWTDRAGYYMFLPATFLYDFSADKFPVGIDTLTGNGFYFDKDKNIVRTKYTYGVSLMELPFFLIADLITSVTHSYSRDGFSFLYQKAIDAAAVFYLVMGLYLLFRSLKIYFNCKSKSILLTLLLTFAGTNLYYYSISEPGMSHVYSFFLFSWLLYLVCHKTKFSNEVKYNILLSLIVWLIVLVRPLNFIFVPVIFIWDAAGGKEILKRVAAFFKPKIMLVWLIAFLIVFAPQMMYWKYVSGKYIYYSYGEDRFSNLLSPKIIEVLFAPGNGFLPYCLMFIFMIAGVFLFMKRQKVNGMFMLITFTLLIYLTGSWYTWQFGCGCGQRNFVEYYSLFAFPFCFFINRTFEMKKGRRTMIFISVALLALINLKINYHFPGCYYGDTWDWSAYWKILSRRL